MPADHVLQPPPLAPGACIGICAPAGPLLDPTPAEVGMEGLTALGYTIQIKAMDATGPDYLAGTDDRRLQELHALWADPDIHAIMALRGGYGCMRLLDNLDMDLIRQHPKWLIGFSDLSALLNPVAAVTGMVTLHGPVVTTLAATERATVMALTSWLKGQPCPPAEPLRVLRPGSAHGRLFGGNLTTLVHLIGTPWEIPWNDCLLFLEDTGETMYRIDRMLTQMAACAIFDRINGLLLGTFDCGRENGEANMALQAQVEARILELTPDPALPVWTDLPSGHLASNWPLPIGMAAQIDSDGLLHYP